jgi:hypothetical protein
LYGAAKEGDQMTKRSKFVSFLEAVTAAPVEVALYIPERISRRHDYLVSYEPDPNWEVRLHKWLGAPWPCPEWAELDVLWSDIASELQTQGLRFGNETYGGYGDAAISLARAIWCTVLHLRPSVVVETGVAQGVTSRIVLEALNRNDRGHLWSIDLPHLFQRNLHANIGTAVPASLKGRWSYIEGSSRRRLRGVLRSLAQVDLFIHDTLTSARNTRFEMEQTLNSLASGGIMIIDDIGMHQAFADFARDFPSLETVVCPHPDRAGSLFGLVYKPA